jgi:hypothetical protein
MDQNSIAVSRLEITITLLKAVEFKAEAIIMDWQEQ